MLQSNVFLSFADILLALVLDDIVVPRMTCKLLMRLLLMLHLLLLLAVGISLVHVQVRLTLMLWLIRSLCCNLSEVFLEHLLFRVVILMEGVVALDQVQLVVVVMEVVIQVEGVGVVE